MILFYFILGACLGSFVGCVITRIPRGISIIAKPSYCLKCKKIIPWLHKIPIFSGIYLKGKCLFCKTSFGYRTIFLEVFFGCLSGYLYFRYGFSFAYFEKILFCLLLTCIAYIDLDHFLIPVNALVLLIIFGLFTILIYYLNPSYADSLNSFFSVLEVLPKDFFVSSKVLGGVLGFGLFSIINFFATKYFRWAGRINKDQWAMGWGDPILVGGIGLFVGLEKLLGVIFVSSLLGSLVGLIQLLLGVESKDKVDVEGAVPFGSFIAVAGMLLHLL